MRRAPRCLLTTSAGPAQDADVSAAALTLVAIKAAQPEPGLADLGAAAGGTSGPAKRKRGGIEVRRCSPMHASLSAAGAGHARGAAGRRRQCSCACAGGRPVLCRPQARCDSRSRARACKEGPALRAQPAASPIADAMCAPRRRTRRRAPPSPRPPSGAASARAPAARRSPSRCAHALALRHVLPRPAWRGAGASEACAHGGKRCRALRQVQLPPRPCLTASPLLGR
jgi:hypothetical protein